eukprot:CFRG5542T1
MEAINFVGKQKTVRHDPTNKRFVMPLKGSDEATIEYRVDEKGRYDLYHAAVPGTYRGQGVGEVLAVGAVDRLKEENIPYFFTCSYLIKLEDKKVFRRETSF